MDSLTVEAPASSANLGPGFDVFSIALREPMDILSAEFQPGGGLIVEVRMKGDINVTGSPARNAAAAVARSVAKEHGIRGRITLELTKGVPVGVGLGSSGASSAAAAFAMNKLLRLKMTAEAMIKHAGEGEKAASGFAHLDNVTASLLGGFIVVRPGSPPLRFQPPKSLAVVVVTPKVSLPQRKTAYARSLVPKKVPTARMVANVAMASTVVAGFSSSDIRTIGEGMEDSVVEVARAKMVPGFANVKRAAKEAGGAGACMSGAGPSVLSFVDKRNSNPASVLDAMVGAFRSVGVESRGFVTSIGEGARAR